MRYLLHLLAFVAAEPPPEFVVVNKMPPTFTVTNRIAPEVARPKGVTFQRDNFDPDHQCNRCGRSQFVISGWLPNGQHTHTCRSCNYTWRH